MKNKVLPVLIVFMACMGSYILYKNKVEPEENEAVKTVIAVDGFNLHKEDVHLRVYSQGIVQPSTQTTLISEVSGLVLEVSQAFVVGGYFNKGDILIRLNDQNYLSTVSNAEAAVASAYSQLELEKGQADVAQREWNRMSEDQQSQVTARNLYLRKPQLEEAEARLSSAQAELNQAKSELSKTTIVAPYDGIVIEKNADIGQFVNSGSTIAEILSIDYAEVRLPIPESKLSSLDLPTRLYSLADVPVTNKVFPDVELSSSVGGVDVHWSGKLIRTEEVLDTRARVLYGVVQIEDPYQIKTTRSESAPLRIGAYVNASILGRLLLGVYVIPRNLLHANNQVWVINEEGYLQLRSVEVAAVNIDYAYITSGYENGDMAVVTRLENPLSGQAVKVNLVPKQEVNH